MQCGRRDSADPVLTFFLLRVTNDLGQVSAPDTVKYTVLERDNILFEDPSLEIKARRALNMPDQVLTEADLMEIDTLHEATIITDYIVYLSGIELCKNMRYAFLGFQKIVDLSPLSTLTELIELSLTQNHIITDITPLAGLIHLRELEIDDNLITDISPLANMTEMERLYLSFNSIADISVLANMKNLRDVWITGSPINDISAVTELTNLERLWMTKCLISDITPIKNLVNLKRIKFDINNISDLTPLTKLVNTEWLYMADNQITDITPLKNLVNLTRLRLWNNQITDIKPLVDNEGLGQGDVVSLDNNPLSAKSVNEYIPALQSRGVTVYY